MSFPEFDVVVSYDTFGIIPVDTGKGGDSREVIFDGPGITVSAGRPVVRQVVALIKFAFYPVDVAGIGMHTVIAVFKVGICADKEEGRYAEGKPNDVDKCISPVFE